MSTPSEEFTEFARLIVGAVRERDATMLTELLFDYGKGLMHVAWEQGYESGLAQQDADNPYPVPD
jgi:hypothetical protein